MSMLPLLERCIDAHVEAFGESLVHHPDRALRQGMAGLLTHIAAEIIVMDDLRPGISAVAIAGRLIDAAKEVPL